MLYISKHQRRVLSVLVLADVQHLVTRERNAAPHVCVRTCTVAAHSTSSIRRCLKHALWLVCWHILASNILCTTHASLDHCWCFTIKLKAAVQRMRLCTY